MKKRKHKGGWMRGLWESVTWIAESIWGWISKPRSNPRVWSAVIAAVLLTGCSPNPPPEPSPSPTISPTPTPLPTATPPAGCVVPTNAGKWTELGPTGAEHLAAVIEAESGLGSLCGREPENSLNQLVDRLRQAGLCAARVDDAVFVQREKDRDWDQFFAVDYSDGCWLADPYKGTWAYE